MKKISLLFVLLTMGCVATWAQGPNDSGIYYKNADGYTGAALKTALGGIIESHTNVGYDGLYEGYKKTDTRADGYVRDWYSNSTNYRHGVDNKGNYSKEGDMYNREHTVPQSWFGSGVIKSDIVQVVPTDGYVNNKRGNYPFGEVANITYQSANAYSKLGSCKTSGYNGTVFEPNDEIKGDIARIYFYMVTCYESQAASWSHSVFSTAYNGFEKWALDMLMRWSQQDPVDDIETARNNAVYDVQNNRNPFVDYPGLEDYIWGDKKGQPFSYDNYGGEESFVAMPVITPDAGTYYDQVEVSISCRTERASIFYTTDGSTPTANSNYYSSPFTLTKSATVKAIAIYEGSQSSVASATYTVRTSGGGEQPADGYAQLNNGFFGISETGTIAKSNATDFVGQVGSATVTYALGAGGQRYVGSDHIRVYAGNEVKVSLNSGTLTSITFTEKDNSGKTLQASTGTVSGMTWTGDASEVVFTVSSGSGHMKMNSISITTSGGTGLDYIVKPLSGKRVVYNLRGERVATPTRGLFIVDGKKVVVP